MNAITEETEDRSAPPTPEPPRPPLLVALACAVQWALPGLGYLVLRRGRRGWVALIGLLAMAGWGLHLGGELSRPEHGALLSYLKTFASLGLGSIYFILVRLGRGVGDVTSPTEDYGCSLVWAAGLIAYLLVLDVYDIAVGRKG